MWVENVMEISNVILHKKLTAGNAVFILCVTDETIIIFLMDF